MHGWLCQSSTRYWRHDFLSVPIRCMVWSEAHAVRFDLDVAVSLSAYPSLGCHHTVGATWEMVAIETTGNEVLCARHLIS